MKTILMDWKDEKKTKNLEKVSKFSTENVSEGLELQGEEDMRLLSKDLHVWWFLHNYIAIPIVLIIPFDVYSKNLFDSSSDNRR